MSEQTTTPDSTKTVSMHDKKTFFSLRWKLLIGFTVLFSVVFAIAFYWFFQFATNMAMTRIQEDLMDTIRGASAGIDGDELVSLSMEGQPNADGFSDDPRYQDLLEWLDTVHQVEPRAWPYLAVPGEGEQGILYVVDLYALYDIERAAPFLYKAEASNREKALKDFTLRVNDKGVFDTYQDDWGRWVSAYGPVKNASGESVGLIGVDFQANYVDQVQRSILGSVFIAFAVTYAALFVLVFAVSGTLTQPILKLTKVAERIGEGDYEQDLSSIMKGNVDDEINKLTRVFVIMVDKVRKREQTLRLQVEQLQIQVDESKRQHEVSEIVETDFFRELQSKAQHYRNRRQKIENQDSNG